MKDTLRQFQYSVCYTASSLPSTDEANRGAETELGRIKAKASTLRLFPSNPNNEHCYLFIFSLKSAGP